MHLNKASYLWANATRAAFDWDENENALITATKFKGVNKERQECRQGDKTVHSPLLFREIIDVDRWVRRAVILVS